MLEFPLRPEDIISHYLAYEIQGMKDRIEISTKIINDQLDDDQLLSDAEYFLCIQFILNVTESYVNASYLTGEE